MLRLRLDFRMGLEFLRLTVTAQVKVKAVRERGFSKGLRCDMKQDIWEDIFSE